MRTKLLLLIVICIIDLSRQARKPYSTIHELTLTQTFNTSFSIHTVGRKNILNKNSLFISRDDGAIQQRSFNGTILKIFSDPIQIGQTVAFLEFCQESLISAYTNKLIIKWNVSSAAMINNTYIQYIPGRMGFYLKQLNKLIIPIFYKRGYLFFDVQTMKTSKILFFDSSDVGKNHYCAISPNQQIFIDWWSNSQSIRIYNLTSNGLLKMQQEFGNYFDLNPQKRALFSSDSSQILFAVKGGLLFHASQNNFATSKKIQIFSNSYFTRSVTFLNQDQRILIISLSNSQTLFYDEINNESKMFPSFKHRTDQLSEDKRFILQYSTNETKIYKISCTNNYFYDAQNGLCVPCWINNCSTCQGDTGKCLKCKDILYYININGNCLSCSKNCQSCKDETGECIQCQSPYSLNSSSQCDLQSSPAVQTLQTSISLIASTKLYGTSLLMSFMNQFELYNYHNREYGNRTLLYLKPTNIFQSSKLTMVSQYNSASIFSSLKISSSYSSLTGNKYFVAETGLDNNFWNTSFLFFVQIIPQSLLIFILFKFIFLILFNFQISKHIRQYSFYLFLLPCIFGNHIEYLSYAAFNQLQSMVYMTIWDKLLLMLFLMFLFVFLLYLVAFLLFVLIFHKKTKKYFFDGCSANLAGAFTISIFTTYKGFIMSLIQSFMFQRYVLQTSFMIGVDLMIICLILIIQKKLSCFQKKSTFVCLLVHQFLMIILNILLIIDFKFREEKEQIAFQITDDAIQSTIQFLYLNIIISTILVLNPMKKMKNEQDQSSTSSEQKKDIPKSTKNKLFKLKSTTSNQSSVSIQRQPEKSVILVEKINQESTKPEKQNNQISNYHNNKNKVLIKNSLKNHFKVLKINKRGDQV